LQLERRSLAGSDHRAGRWPKFSAVDFDCLPGPRLENAKFRRPKGTKAEAALRWWLDVWRSTRRRVRHTGFVKPGFQISRNIDQGGCNVSVRGGFGEHEKRRRLTREIVLAYHDIFPARLAAQNSKIGISFRPSRIKAELWKNDVDPEMFGVGFF
jgi:hypothetical protein